MLIVVRNVFHELNIKDTSEVLFLLNHNMQLEDTLLIQDLLLFPQAERGHVCWDSDCLESVLSQVGFEPSSMITRTNSGAQWISLIIRKSKHTKLLSKSKITDIVANGRFNQLEKWRTIEKLPSDTRLNKTAKIDLDLQLASLYNQLRNAGYIGLLQN